MRCEEWGEQIAVSYRAECSIKGAKLGRRGEINDLDAFTLGDLLRLVFYIVHLAVKGKFVLAKFTEVVGLQ